MELGADGVSTRVDNASVRMATLKTQRAEIEVGAESVEHADHVGRARHERTNAVLVGEPGRRDESVARMRVK